MTNEFTKWANQKGEAALVGTWAKIGRSRYQRVSGEIVSKTGNAWRVEGGRAYQTRAAAFSAVDWANR